MCLFHVYEIEHFGNEGKLVVYSSVVENIRNWLNKKSKKPKQKYDILQLSGQYFNRRSRLS